MAGKADFTTDEWDTMQKGVTGAGMFVSLADPGFFDTFKEVGTLTKYLGDARQGNSTQLIRELSEVRGAGFGLGTSPQDLESQTLSSLRGAVATLSAKAPDEVQPYRDFVVRLAQSVAEAAKGVSDSESGALVKIREAVGA